MDIDDELEELMKQRYVPEMRSNLAERIIDASRYHQAKGESGIMLWIYSFRDALILPKPAYVMAAIFMIGLLFGGYTGLTENVSYDLSDYLFTAESVSEGDWL